MLTAYLLAYLIVSISSRIVCYPIEVAKLLTDRSAPARHQALSVQRSRGNYLSAHVERLAPGPAAYVIPRREMWEGGGGAGLVRRRRRRRRRRAKSCNDSNVKPDYFKLINYKVA